MKNRVSAKTFGRRSIKQSDCPGLCVRIPWGLCSILLGFVFNSPGVCVQFPWGFPDKCGATFQQTPGDSDANAAAFYPQLQLPALQAVVPQGVIVGKCRGVVGDGAAVVDMASLQLLLVTDTYRLKIYYRIENILLIRPIPATSTSTSSFVL